MTAFDLSMTSFIFNNATYIGDNSFKDKVYLEIIDNIKVCGDNNYHCCFWDCPDCNYANCGSEYPYKKKSR